MDSGGSRAEGSRPDSLGGSTWTHTADLVRAARYSRRVSERHRTLEGAARPSASQFASWRTRDWVIRHEIAGHG